MAQLGSALDWGSRGRGFKSRQPDEKPQGFLLAVFVVRLLLPGVFAARTSVPGDCRVLICNRNVMRISPLLFLPVKRSFLGNNTAFVQVVHGGCIVSGGHNRFNDCSKLFHRSKSSTGMISTCLLLASGQMTHPFLWLLASRALGRFSTVSTHAASVSPQRHPGLVHEERGRGTCAQSDSLLLRGSLFGTVRIHREVLQCRIRSFRVLELGHHRYLVDGRLRHCHRSCVSRLRDDVQPGVGVKFDNEEILQVADPADESSPRSHSSSRYTNSRLSVTTCPLDTRT